MVSKLGPREMGEIVKLRGLGYSQSEIADKLGVVPGTISYQLRRIKKLSMKEGVNEVFNYYAYWAKSESTNKEDSK